MRKQIIMAALLAATVATPVLAQEDRRERVFRDIDTDAGSQRRERQEARQAERAQARAQAQVQAQPQAQAPVQAQVQAQTVPQREFRGRMRDGNNAGFRSERRRDVQAVPQAAAPAVVDRRPARLDGQQRIEGRRNGDGMRDNRQDRQDRRADRRAERGVVVAPTPGLSGRIDTRDRDWRNQDARNRDLRDRNVQYRNDNRDWRNFNDNRRWNRDWRRDQRYDWQRYRSYNRGFYQLPRYYAPYGYGYGYNRYQRFSIGIRIGQPLFGSRYWIDDPYAYRLPEAYPPYRWVRYYNDALLVDERTGYVADVIYDIFY